MRVDEDRDPTTEEIREALRSILVSPPFVHSPQLGTFLRFVVEQVLAGGAEYIKSYTIAVEALGRSDSFDPKVDPIVRVEAGRLRRALSRYYASGERHAVVIELPLGSYVPIFRRAKLPKGAMASAERLRGLLRRPSRILGGLGALVLVAVACYVAIAAKDSWYAPSDLAEGGKPVADVATPRELSPVPVVFLLPLDTIGASRQQALELEAFGARLRDALSRFDEIAVVSGGAAAPPPGRSIYRLGGLADYRNDGALNLSLWLADSEDGTVVWSRTFEPGADDLRSSALHSIVQKVATKLAQPYGVIYAHELADERADPRHRCVLAAFEYLRGFSPAAGTAADSCLQQLVQRNATFANGFALGALVIVRRYYRGEVDGAAGLEHAATLAQRALELKPQSARARQALMSVLFARAASDAALMEGKAAVAANPYDMILLQAYGLQLVLNGRVEEGAPLIRQAAALSPMRPALFEFGLFLCAYLLGDRDDDLVGQPRLLIDNEYPLVLIARALTAVQAGNVEEARRAINRLLTLYPDWRDNGQERLERYIPSPSISARMARDLAAVGFPVTR